MKLYNNFTTKEQSKRLLELGLPIDSADCFFDGWEKLVYRDERYNDSNFFETHPECVPCWSVGRLLEIICKCSDDNHVFGLRIEKIKKIYDLHCFIDAAISDIKLLQKYKEIDFSYLNN